MYSTCTNNLLILPIPFEKAKRKRNGKYMLLIERNMKNINTCTCTVGTTVFETMYYTIISRICTIPILWAGIDS